MSSMESVAARQERPNRPQICHKSFTKQPDVRLAFVLACTQAPSVVFPSGAEFTIQERLDCLLFLWGYFWTKVLFESGVCAKASWQWQGHANRPSTSHLDQTSLTQRHNDKLFRPFERTCQSTMQSTHHLPLHTIQHTWFGTRLQSTQDTPVCLLPLLASSPTLQTG